MTYRSSVRFLLAAMLLACTAMLLACTAMLLACTAARADDATLPPGVTPASLVAAADRIRNPGQPFRLTNTLTQYVSNAPRDQISLTVFARQDAASGQYQNLIRYAEPARDVGKLLLMSGTQLWFYDPSSKASIRISPQQRLIGEAADGDVVTVNMARDYTATLVGRESVTDGDHAARDCWHLLLAAANPDAVYSKVEYWLDHASSAPVRARYFADSGRLLKVAYFRRYQMQLNALRPTEIVILDGVDPHLVTVMDYADYRLVQIPDSWLQRDFLPYLDLHTN